MTGELAKALIGFQSEMPVVAKKHTAEVPTKSGGKYSYTYAGLADITEQAMPILGKHGLAFASCPRPTDRGYELCGWLLHESGETLEGALPIAGNTPQELGSSITYMRRYLFGSMTGLVTDDDDDGQLAQRGATRPRAAKKVDAEKLLTPEQSAHMFALFGEKGITDRDVRLAGISRVVGREVASSKDLTTREASLVIDSLKPPAEPEEQP